MILLVWSEGKLP